MMSPILTKLSGLVGKRGRADRRTFRRLTPGHLTPCHVRVPGNEQRSAWVHNLSLRGVGILADREFTPGTRLGLLLVNAAHTFALSVEMDVVRCFRVVNGDFFVGGQFDRQLGHDELMPFMM
jgi:PilZ domain